MKTAVLISGQLRTFKKCYPTQKWQVFRHYEPDIHFFVSICNDAQACDVSLLQRDYPSVNVSVETYSDPTDLPVIPIEKGSFAPYANATTHDKLMLQHWGNKKVWDFFASKVDPSSFDTVIRIRPDQWIHTFQVPSEAFVMSVCCPWWGKFGGINDRLAIMSGDAAPIYFSLFDAIAPLVSRGCPFHPETLLASHLQENKVLVRNTLITEFSTVRMDGSQRWWQQEVMLSDLAGLIATK